MHRPCDAGDPARSCALEVVGIDVQANHALARGCAIRCTTGAQGFGQHHRHTAVQQPVRLDGARIDRHPGANEIVTDFKELDTQVADGGAGAGRGQQFNRDGLLPDSHEMSKDGKKTLTIRSENNCWARVLPRACWYCWPGPLSAWCLRTKNWRSGHRRRWKPRSGSRSALGVAAFPRLVIENLAIRQPQPI